MSNSEKSFPIHYVLVMPQSASDFDQTPFQGWSPVILQDRFIHLLHLVGILPFRTSDIFLNHEQLLEQRRKNVERNISAVGEHVVREVPLRSPDVLTIYVCMPRQIAAARANQELSEGPFLILSTVGGEDGIVNVEKIVRFSPDIIDQHICSAIGVSNDGLRQPYSTTIKIPLGHGVTRPNLLLLCSSGFTIDEEVSGILPEDDNVVFELISRTAEMSLEAVAGPEASRQRDLILYCPAVKSGWYDFRSSGWNQLLRSIPQKSLRHFIESALFRNKNYSRTDAHKDAKVNDFSNNETVRYISSIRLSELAATTAAIGLLSSSTQAASLRLPNSLNLHGKELANLEMASKVSGPKAARILQTRFGNLVANMRNEIGRTLRETIETQSRSCVLCCDAPLEWVYLGDLPLMISHEVSRLPMTPGNMLLEFAAVGQRILMPEILMRKVLVVRSFSYTDPIRPMLQQAIEKMGLSTRMNISFVDVNCRQDAISALNAFDGALVVFDCHGNHGGVADEGWLQFGADKVVTWELAHVARIPPVVILSACLTTAAAGSHASVSSGLLRSGAISVLGTYLPVGGPESAIFVSRILYRIDAFLPALGRLGMRAVSWRTFLSTFLRMSFATDVLDHFISLGLIDVNVRNEIQLEANMRINSLNKNWYDKMLESVAAKCSSTKEELSSAIKNDNPFLETLNYCQVGMPERLYIELEST